MEVGQVLQLATEYATPHTGVSVGALFKLSMAFIKDSIGEIRAI